MKTLAVPDRRTERIAGMPMPQIGSHQRISPNFRKHVPISHMRDPPARDTSSFFSLHTDDETTWKEWRQGRSTHPRLMLPLTLNNSHGVVPERASCPRAKTRVYTHAGILETSVG